MKPYLIGRMIDVALINALVFGNADVRTFCFWVISMLIVFMLIGVVSMNAETAKVDYTAQSAVKRVIKVTISLLYIPALIYAGFPVQAALYAIAALLLFAAFQALNEKAR